MNMLYHTSSVSGIKTLEPIASTHGERYVYATYNRAASLLFGARHDDFDLIVDIDDGVPTVFECCTGAFQSVYRGKSCSLYSVSPDGFEGGKTEWKHELVSTQPVTVLGEERINDLYSRLSEESACGNLILHMYEHDENYKKMIAGHIVDRLIRFEILDGETVEERLMLRYGGIIHALRGAMDGHLLD